MPTPFITEDSVGLNAGAEQQQSAPPRRAWSLRSRLMWLATVTTVLAWLTGGAGMLIAAYTEGEKLYEDQLREVAEVLLAFVGHEIEEIRAEGRDDVVHAETAATLDPRYAYQVWSRDGRLLLMSHNASRQPYAPLDQEGMTDTDASGRPLCVFSLRSNDGGLLIQVAEDESQRQLLRPRFQLALLAFFLGSITLLLLLNRWVFGGAMRALDQSAQQLTNRSPVDLRPVTADDPPRELQPMLSSINCLFARIERTLDAERHFTSAAAHELRTPLAAVRMQAQIAARARTPQEAQASLKSLVSCVDRASHLIDQLLLLARVDTLPSDATAFKPVRIDHVIQQVVRDMAPVFERRRVEVDLQLDAAAVPAIEFGLAALIRNLIDNAVQHAESGRRVLVCTFARDDEVVLTVEDAGPGIPESERMHVFERFYRLADSTTDGCGVGLSIVQSVATAHRAHVALDAVTRGGLRVTVIFPRADRASP